MKDSDPRPMPPEVARAYRNPLNLSDLLSSPVFTDRDRIAVRDELLDRLVRKHGNVEVEIGKGNRTLPIRNRVAQFRKNVWGGIEVMVAAEELGGRDAVMLDLATVMQPYWLRWWDEMNWDSYDSMRASIKNASNVLGSRQLAWLSAQYARSVLDISLDRQICIAAISAAETWAVVPSEENLERSDRAASATYTGSAYTAASAARSSLNAARAAASAAASRYYAALHTADAAHAADAAYSAAYAAGNDIYSAEEEAETRERVQTLYGLMYARGSRDVELSLNSAGRAISPYVIGEGSYMFAESRMLNSEDRKKLEGITRELITPTLITNAARAM